MVAEALIVLTLTLPSFNSAVDDSGGILCDATSTPLQDLDSLRLYRVGRNNMVSFVRAKWVGGKTGQEDTLHVEPGWTYYVRSQDTSGNKSCASNSVAVPGAVTGVEPEPGKTLINTRYYDVHGRRVIRPTAAGIYWERRRFSDGSTSLRRIVRLK
jgi:hypothetical protein